MNAAPHICFFGLANLPVLAPGFGEHGIGGEQVQHALLGKALVERGYRVSMVVGDYGQPDGAIWSGITTYKAFKPDEGIPVLRFVHPRWTRMWSALKRANADIYYASSAGMHIGLIALFCRMHGKKMVYRVAHDNDCNPEAVKVLVKYARDRFLYRLGVNRVDAVLVQSEQQKSALVKHYGLDSHIASMLVTPHAPRTEVERDIDVLWVNNLRQFKRPDIVLKLAEAMPHLRFHMIGGEENGFADLYAEVKRRAARLPNLVYHDRVPYSEVNRFYERAKVFINTSDSEGFPNSFLQAWIRGAPVISFFDPDGVIRRNGLGLAVDSTEKMAEGIQRLVSDPAAREAIARDCIRYMQSHYDADVILAPYRKTFDSLASVCA